ncbi:MAG: fumarate hydratase [Spiribacter sp.]|nr:fumarate hydratase [Spiribacter sp.]
MTETYIRKDDVIQSVADALQFIACYHPADFLQALHAAWQKEQSSAARDAMAQILTNSRLCAEGRRPICQDTGIVTVFVDVGMQVRWDTDSSLEQMINAGVARAYQDADNPLRASIVADPAGARVNTGDNTPAIIHTRLVPGNTVRFRVAAKGGGSEAKARFAMLNPSDDIAQWVLDQIPAMGAGWCPPGVIGIGIGGSAERAMQLAKEACLEPLDIHELQAQGPQSPIDALRLDLYERINQLGIGAQGLGGLTTVLDVKILDHPTHAANQPVALIPNCAANRHVHFTLNGDGVASLPVPRLADWPDVDWRVAENTRRVDLESVSSEEMAQWRAGDTLLLSGRLLTARDAAHKRIQDYVMRSEPLPVELANRFIYYVGPVDAVADEAVGPAGPTTATRMDKFSELMLADIGIAGMIGKAERSAPTVEAIRRHGAVYLIAVGGAAYLVSRAIREARVVAFEDLGMEAIHEFVVDEMPVTVAVDAQGTSIHETGPRQWQQRFAGVPIRLEGSQSSPLT